MPKVDDVLKSTTFAVNGPLLTRLRGPLVLFLVALVAPLVDEEFVRLLNPDQPHVFDGLAVWLDKWSTRCLLLVCFAGTFLAFSSPRFLSWRRHAATFTFGWVITQGLVESLKDLVGRARPLRPEAIGDHLRPLFENVDERSFPSGHAATATACAVVITLFTRNLVVRWAVWIFAILVSLGRSYIGAHFLSDITAGAGIGWLVMIFARHLAIAAESLYINWTVSRIGSLLWWIAFTVLSTWMLKDPLRLVEFVSGLKTTDFRQGVTTLGLLFEPWTGFGMKISSSGTGFKTLLLSGALVAVLAAASLIFWLRRRSIGVFLVLGLWLVTNAWSALTPTVLRGPLREKKSAAPHLIFDLHSHGGDVYDGHESADVAAKRFAALGYDVFVPTHHNVWSQGQKRRDRTAHFEGMQLYGMEWSAGPAQGTDLHLLVYNNQPKPADLGEEKDWRRMIERARASGGVVIAAHYWRPVNPRSTRPSLDELFAAGIAGVEVANRNQEMEPELIQAQNELLNHEKIARRGFGNSDYHGRRAFNYCWNAAPRSSLVTVEEHLLNLLRNGAAPRVVALEQTISTDRLPWIFRSLEMLIAYFRELSLPARGVWLLWLALCGSGLRVFALRRAARF